MAYKTGYLVDPESGAELVDFEKYIAPYFQLNIYEGENESDD